MFVSTQNMQKRLKNFAALRLALSPKKHAASFASGDDINTRVLRLAVLVNYKGFPVLFVLSLKESLRRIKEFIALLLGTVSFIRLQT